MTPRSGPTLDLMSPDERRRVQTPQRQIRVPDTAFYPAVARAKADGTSIGHVVTALLDRYARGELDV